jgi:hypothetical protein
LERRLRVLRAKGGQGFKCTTISPSISLGKNAKGAEGKMNICCVVVPTLRIKYPDKRIEGGHII